MEVKNLINLTLDKNNCFIDEAIKINVYRGKLYSKFIIFIEVAFEFNRYILKLP